MRSHLSIIRKFGVLALLVFIVYSQLYLFHSGGTNETLKGWIDSIRSEQKLSSAEFAAYLYRKMKYDTSPNWIDTYTLNENLLTLPLGPKQGTKLRSIEELRFYESDPRLTWSVLLEHLQTAEAERKENRVVSFSWYDWSDFHMFNKLVSLQEVNFGCGFLYETAFELTQLEAIEKEINDVLFISDRLKYNDPKWMEATRKKEIERNDPVVYPESRCRRYSDKSRKFNLPVEAHQLDEQCRPEVFALQTRSYLLNHYKNPISLTLMEHDNSSYRVFVDPNDRSNIQQSGYLKSFLQKNGVTTVHNDNGNGNGRSGKKNPNVVFDHWKQYNIFLQSNTANHYRTVIPEIDKVSYDRDFVHLSDDLFEVNVPSIIEELESIENPNPHDKEYLESLKISRETHPALASKFLSEAAHITQFNGMGYHRDKRFFNGALIHDPLEYQLRLNALIRNWLKFTRSNGLITWLAHGTVYGQLYNGLTFPWDNDFDVQMPIKHLHLLSRYFNQSLIMEDPREGNGKYFLDVTNSITVRTSGNGFNNIDARFIDVDSGLYVDITGLSVSSTPLSDKLTSDYKKFSAIFDSKSYAKDKKWPERGEGLASMDIFELQNYTADHSDKFSSDQLKKIEELVNHERNFQQGTDKPESGSNPNERYWTNKELKAYNCRNNHFVTLELLSPLTSTVFHGVHALVPRKVAGVLKNEYNLPKQFGFEVFDGKAYLPALHSWFNYNVLKRFANSNSWNTKLQKIKSPISKLDFPDIKLLLDNMLKLGYNDLFTICYNAFNVTSYRYKEREIQFDNSTSKNEKFKLLHILRNDVAPQLSSPGKDPYMFNYERRMWRKVGATIGNTIMRAIHKAVETQASNELWSSYVATHEGRSELFITRNELGDVEIDLNNHGRKITEPNTILESDPF